MDDIFKNKCMYASKLIENPQTHLEGEEIMLLVEMVTDVFEYTELNKEKLCPEFEIFLANFTDFIKNKKQRGRFKDVYYSNHNENNNLTNLLKSN